MNPSINVLGNGRVTLLKIKALHDGLINKKLIFEIRKYFIQFTNGSLTHPLKKNSSPKINKILIFFSLFLRRKICIFFLLIMIKYHRKETFLIS